MTQDNSIAPRPNDAILSDEAEEHLQDYTFSRITLYKLLNQGMQSLTNIKELAEESENPRAFEVFSNYMKNMADISDKLVELQDKHFKLMAERKKEDPNLIEHPTMKDIGEIVFQGETAQVLKRIENDD